MNERVSFYNDHYKLKFSALIQSGVSRQEYHFLSTLVLRSL